MSKTTKIRNVKAFVKAYLIGKNGQAKLRQGKPLAVQFLKALDA